MIAAHPDDENTAVLAWLARGRYVRTGYLSLTRGEGGQNLIGPEQGELLGLIRTQELLAARRIDGAEQFFTRAIDFGYTKTASETLAKWGHDKILSDVVWTIRRFRPDIVILRFSGTARDGHGQHQVSAILGKEAFSAAADPARFPEQLAYVKPWQAKRLLWNSFRFTREQEQETNRLKDRIEIDTGDFDPILGKSYAEIAGISRSQHRSQGMGAGERRGSARDAFVVVAGDPAQNDLFDGVDLSWNRVQGGAEIGGLISKAIERLDPAHPERVIPDLLAARKLIAQRYGEKLQEIDEAIAQCAGIWVDAASDRYAVAPGESVNVRLTALDRSGFPFDAVQATLANSSTKISSSVLAYNKPAEATAAYTIPADQPYSQPFWLVKPPEGDTYVVDDQQLIGLADSPPVLEAKFQLSTHLSNQVTTIELTRPVRYRYVDRVQGELTRPLTVVPPVAVNMTESVRMFPGTEARDIRVSLQANKTDARGEVKLEAPAGWSAQPASRPFRLGTRGEQQELLFEVTPPSGYSIASLRALAMVDGRRIDRGMQIISYPHIPVQTVFPPADEKLARIDIKVLAKKIGYIMGAGDEMPKALGQIGCDVVFLSAADLQQRNLSEFDAIVAGVRAYNVRSDLLANQQRLLDYVQDGGTYIVQYNTADRGAPPQIGPYPLTVTMDQQRHDRVSVEDAPVSFPNPRNPLLHAPNEITQHDFEGWVQERGLYFASKWDSHYEPVLECHDPGAPAALGGMLYTRYGKGVYIFSAYSWFRQLPAGVPGAYRIFANMLSAGYNKVP